MNLRYAYFFLNWAEIFLFGIFHLCSVNKYGILMRKKYFQAVVHHFVIERTSGQQVECTHSVFKFQRWSDQLFFSSLRSTK